MESTNRTVEFADVLIVGGGPVGLLIALGLAQQDIDTLLIEKRELDVQEKFGRACTLYPRTLELLDLLDLSGDIIQAAYIGRQYGVFKDGQRVHRRTFQSMFPLMDQSFHNYITNIRQNNSQRVFTSRYKSDFGKRVHYGWELVQQAVDSSLGDGYNVTATLSHVSLGERMVRCKYLVGADGGQSSVRRLANIEMEGNDTPHKWIRIDGRFKTNMPEPNVVFAGLETKNHGSVLWAKLDKDIHRIGFGLNTQLQEKYPDGITEEQAVQEAIDCMKPFTLEIQRLDWWTFYSIKQKLATTFQRDQFILLAGDAAHTHSSAFAQGMNTGVHDATNLTWKLAGTLKGWYTPDVLASYAAERRGAAEKLLRIDRQAAAAVSGDSPAVFANAGLTAAEALQSIMEVNMNFTIGLGIGYDASVLNKASTASTLILGTRSPDALVYAPGPAVPIRIHTITHTNNKGRWNILIFAGNHVVTKSKYIALREIMTAEGSNFDKRSHIINTSTILLGNVCGAWDAFDGPALGRLYYDNDSRAHSSYGVYSEAGGIFVIRPDGIFAFAAGLDEAHLVEEYFGSIFV